jgi:hypothetical protein
MHPALAALNTPGRIAALLLASAALMLAFHLPGTGVSQADLQQISGGEGLLDARPFYTAAQAQASLHAWGDEGRALVQRYLLADGFFILCYALGLSLWIHRLQPPARWAWLPFVPQWLAVVDALEDASTAALLLAYPDAPPALPALAGWITLSKHLLSLATLIGLAWLLGRWLWRRRMSGR